MGEFYVCEIVKAGPTQGDNVALLLKSRDNVFPGNRWFAARPSMKREMLATALAAATNNYPVDVYLSSLNEGSEVEVLHFIAK